jgi:predicted esterase
LRNSELREPNRWTAGAARAVAAALSCALIALGAGCEGPTLWIGDAVPDAATPDATVDVNPPPNREISDAAPTGSFAPTGAPRERPPNEPGVTTQTEPPREAEPDPDDAGTPAGAPRSRDEPAVHPAEPVLSPADLPHAKTPCPTIKGHGMYRFGDPNGRNLMAEVYLAPDAKSKPGPGGPLVLYWHAIGDDSTEVVSGFGQPAIDDVVAQGGMVASFTEKLCITCGIVAEDVVWYDEDDQVTDHVVACAIEQANIDLRRIHSVGFSAGALRTMHLALARSNYIASVVSYSGGLLGTTAAKDPDNKVPALLSFGRQGSDTIGLNFTDASLQWYSTNKALGYYSLLCQHDGMHVIPEDLVPHVIEFLRDHPYRVSPEPYAMAIPADYPSYCSNTPPP